MEAKEALELATRWLDIVSMYRKEYQQEREAAAVLRRLIPFVEAGSEYCEVEIALPGHPDADRKWVRFRESYRALKEGK